VRFSTILRLVQPNHGANYVTFECADGYTTSLDLADLTDDSVLLAYKLDDRPLEVSLGGPLKLVAPAKHAYKSAMWIEHASFTKKKELGYWEKRGYSDAADAWKNERLGR